MSCLTGWFRLEQRCGTGTPRQAVAIQRVIRSQKKPLRMGFHSNGILLACILRSVSRKLLPSQHSYLCPWPKLRASGNLPGKKAHQVPSSDSVEARTKTDQKVLQVISCICHISQFWGEDRAETGLAECEGQMSKLWQAMHYVWRWRVKSLDKSGLNNYLSICWSRHSVSSWCYTGHVRFTFLCHRWFRLLWSDFAVCYARFYKPSESFISLRWNHGRIHCPTKMARSIGWAPWECFGSHSWQAER